MLFSRIDVQLGSLGHDVPRTRSGLEPATADVAICDAEQVDPEEAVKVLRPARLLAFGSHESPEALKRARQAGFDRVVARSALVDRLPGMVDALLATTPSLRRSLEYGGPALTYIITEPCIDLKDKSCVDVCPVDCIHEADRMLVIDPEECIDCGACEPECPVEAIFPEDAVPDKWEPFIKINYAYPDGLDDGQRAGDGPDRGQPAAADPGLSTHAWRSG